MDPTELDEEDYAPQRQQHVLHRDKLALALLPKQANEFQCYAGHEKLLSEVEISEYKNLEMKSNPGLKGTDALRKAKKKAKRPYQVTWDESRVEIENKKDGRLWTTDCLSKLTSKTAGYRNLAIKQLLLCRPPCDGQPSEAVQLWPVPGGAKPMPAEGAPSATRGVVPLTGRWEIQNIEAWEPDKQSLPEDPTRDVDFLKNFGHQLLCTSAPDPQELLKQVFSNSADELLCRDCFADDVVKDFIKSQTKQEGGKAVPFFVQVLLEQEGWKQYAWDLESPGFVQIQIPAMNWGNDLEPRIVPGMVLYGRNWRKQYDERYNSKKDRPEREQTLLDQFSSAEIAKVSVHEDPFSSMGVDAAVQGYFAQLAGWAQDLFVSHSFVVIEFKEDAKTKEKPPAVVLEYRWRHSTQYPFTRVPVELGAHPNSIWGKKAKYEVMEIPTEMMLPPPPTWADLRLIPLINLPSSAAAKLDSSNTTFKFQNEDRAVYTSEEFARWRQAATSWFAHESFEYKHGKMTTPEEPAQPRVRVDDGVIGASASASGLRADLPVDQWKVWWNWNDHYGGHGLLHQLAVANPMRRAMCPWMSMAECEKDIRQHAVETTVSEDAKLSDDEDRLVSVDKEVVKGFIRERNIQLHILQDSTLNEIPVLFSSATEVVEWIRAVRSYGIVDASQQTWTFPALVEAGLTYMSNTVKGGTAKRDRFNAKDAAGNLCGSGYYDKLALNCQSVAADVFRSISGCPSNIPAFSNPLKELVGSSVGAIHYKPHKGWFALPGVLTSVFQRAVKEDHEQKMTLQYMSAEFLRMMRTVPEDALRSGLVCQDGSGDLQLTNYGNQLCERVFLQVDTTGAGAISLEQLRSSQSFSHYRGLSNVLFSTDKILEMRRHLMLNLMRKFPPAQSSGGYSG